jgi:hypothetical protein
VSVTTAEALLLQDYQRSGEKSLPAFLRISAETAVKTGVANKRQRHYVAG